jgi:hypothetical protein
MNQCDYSRIFVHTRGGHPSAFNQNGGSCVSIPVCLVCDVHRPFSSPPRSLRLSRGQMLIAVGLALLLVSTWVPTVPAVTAMAILTWGATDATIGRFQCSPACAPVLMLHAITYAALYGLFMAATLHAIGSEKATSLPAAAYADLTLSTLPIFIAVRHIAAAARGV